jgi:predicted MPP superfamily phosphohydrolase
MICGHTHGGQAWIPGVGRPVVPRATAEIRLRLGPRTGVRCVRQRGIGTSILPMRFEVPPEINVIELRVA